MLLAFTSLGRAQEPSVETVSFYQAFQFTPETGTLELSSFLGVFLPKATLYNDRELIRAPHPCVAVLRGATSDREIERWTLANSSYESVFTLLKPVGRPLQYTFTEAGSFRLAIQIEDLVVTEVPLTIVRTESGDPSAPTVRTSLEGPWSKLGCLRLGNLAAPDGEPTLLLWVEVGNPKADDNAGVFTFEVRRQGQVAFVASETRLETEPHDSGWRILEKKLEFAHNAGGASVFNRDLVKHAGEYEVLVKRAGTPYATYRFEVRNGRVVPHRRQEFGFQPHRDYLCPRSPVFDRRPACDQFWMDRERGTDQAVARLEASFVRAHSNPDWISQPKSKEPRPFALHLTSIATRMDAGLAVGDDVIVYGLGQDQGVAFVRTNDGAEPTLPKGSGWDSKLFLVCGKKIVLTRGPLLAVYDTETERLHEFPADQIFLSKDGLDAYGAWPFAADGNLVATLNDPSKVADQRSLKILDLSGREPKIFTLQNPLVPAKDLHAIAVEAASGLLAVGCPNSQRLLVGSVASNSSLQAIDLRSFGGLGADSPLHISGAQVVYADATGSRNLCVANLEDGSVRTLGRLGSTGSQFAAHAGNVAFVTPASTGTNLQFTIGSLPIGAVDTQTAAHAAALAPRNGNFGMGVSVVLLDQALCFLAGQGKGGIGPGEHLQVFQGDTWSVVAAPDGTPLSAVDVVGGPRLIAFKYGSNEATHIGYAVFDESLQARTIRPAAE